MKTSIYHEHDNIRIEFSAVCGCYYVYENGKFIESLDKYDTDDMKRLKELERM